MDATVSLSRNPSILGAFVAGHLMGGSVLGPQELLGAPCTIKKIHYCRSLKLEPVNPAQRQPPKIKDALI